MPALIACGPGRATKTIAEAYAAAAPGDIIRLQAAAEHVLAKQLDLNKPGVWIGPDDPAAPPPVVRFTGTPTAPGWRPEWSQAFNVQASGVTIQGIGFAVAAAKAVRVARAADVSLVDLFFDGAGIPVGAGVSPEQICGVFWAIDASGTTRLRIIRPRIAFAYSYGVFLHDGNAATYIENPAWYGSAWEHACRVSDQNGLIIAGGTMLSPQSGPGRGGHPGALSLRGGCVDITVQPYGGGAPPKLERPGVGAQTAAPDETQRVENVRITAELVGGAGIDLHPTKNERDAANAKKAGSGDAMLAPVNVWLNGVRLDAPPVPPVPPVPTAADVARGFPGSSPAAVDQFVEYVRARLAAGKDQTQ